MRFIWKLKGEGKATHIDYTNLATPPTGFGFLLSIQHYVRQFEAHSPVRAAPGVVRWTIPDEYGVKGVLELIVHVPSLQGRLP